MCILNLLLLLNIIVSLNSLIKLLLITLNYRGVISILSILSRGRFINTIYTLSARSTANTASIFNRCRLISAI